MASAHERVSIYDWAVIANLQPEPITVEVWRCLPEEFCRQAELVNGQVVRCEHHSRAHQDRGYAGRTWPGRRTCADPGSRREKVINIVCPDTGTPPTLVS